MLLALLLAVGAALTMDLDKENVDLRWVADNAAELQREIEEHAFLFIVGAHHSGQPPHGCVTRT